jgi:hypothetical protein
MAKVVEIFDRPNDSVNQNQVKVSGAQVTLVDTNTPQTLTNKTFTAPAVNTPTMYQTVATLAGTGANIATANAITSVSPALILATGGNNSVGILLPVAVAGARYTVKNDQAANGVMKVYPQVNSTINGLSANTAISMAANTCCDFVAFNSITWYTMPLLPS